MGHSIKFTLVKSARGSGGDRYEGILESEDRPMVIYIPQSISRKGGTPVKILEIEIRPIFLRT